MTWLIPIHVLKFLSPPLLCHSFISFFSQLRCRTTHESSRCCTGKSAKGGGWQASGQQAARATHGASGKTQAAGHDSPLKQQPAGTARAVRRVAGRRACRRRGARAGIQIAGSGGHHLTPAPPAPFCSASSSTPTSAPRVGLLMLPPSALADGFDSWRHISARGRLAPQPSVQRC
jgi:hypothetical protein